jgi:hypothetical protein
MTPILELSKLNFLPLVTPLIEENEIEQFLCVVEQLLTIFQTEIRQACSVGQQRALIPLETQAEAYGDTQQLIYLDFQEVKLISLVVFLLLGCLYLLRIYLDHQEVKWLESLLLAMLFDYMNW